MPLSSSRNAGGTPSLAFSSMADRVNETRWVIEKTGEVFPNAVDGAVRISDWAASHGHTLPVHPTQLYESLGQMVLFATLMTARRWRTTSCPTRFIAPPP